MSAARRLLTLLSTAALAFSFGATASAQPSDLAVKAAFLTKFGAYVGWPHAPSGPITLCVVGSDPFGGLLDSAARGQQVDGHPLTVRRLAGAAGSDGCEIAFVEGASAARTAELLHALKGRPVLTVTDSRAGPQRGMIFFVVDGGRVRFHIDQAAAQQSGLTLSSRLLALALSVRSSR